MKFPTPITLNAQSWEYRNKSVKNRSFFRFWLKKIWSSFHFISSHRKMNYNHTLRIFCKNPKFCPTKFIPFHNIFRLQLFDNCLFMNVTPNIDLLIQSLQEVDWKINRLDNSVQLLQSLIECFGARILGPMYPFGRWFLPFP